MRKLYIAGLVAAVVLIAGIVVADQMTFTTYYPAPFGVYNNMVVMNSLGVGTTNPLGMFHVDPAPDGPDNIPNNADDRDDDFIINSTGRLGIGTTDPPQKLTIRNGAIELQYRGNSPGNNVGIGISQCGKMLFYRNQVSNNEIAMVIEDQRGQVGIGTTVPLAQLHVQGESMWLTNGTEEGQTVKIIFADTNDYIYHKDQDRPATIEYMGFVINDYELITLNSATLSGGSVGSVGIGTSNPRGKLDVNGTIYQRGGELHADYVFEPDYELESIDEHAQYMWQSKHLKGVPKAELDENGQQVLEIGAHRRGILEELEKAHVYIQQLNGQIKALEAMVVKRLEE